jgi:hypothetical protein
MQYSLILGFDGRAVSGDPVRWLESLTSRDAMPKAQ